MSDYNLAVTVWALVAGSGLAASFLALLAHETRIAVDCLRSRFEPHPPLSSDPNASAPSSPGF